MMMSGGQAEADNYVRAGDIMAQGVSSAGQLVGNALAQHEQTKKIAARDAAWSTFVESGEWLKDPRVALTQSMRVWGPEKGPVMAQGLAAFATLSEKGDAEDLKRVGQMLPALANQSDEVMARMWPGIKARVAPVLANQLGIDPSTLGDQWDPRYRESMTVLDSMLNGQKEPPKPVQVDTVDENGNPVTRFVTPRDGQSFAKPGPKPEDRMVTTTDANGNPIQRLASEEELRRGVPGYREPKTAPPVDQPNWQWVNRNGKPVHTNRPEPGDEPLRAPTQVGNDPVRASRMESAQGFLDRLNELRGKINTKMGPSAGLTGLARRGLAQTGMDPDVAEYERIRAAGGRALAVAIMGAANLSDDDAQAWANMLPDALTDKETADRLTTQVGKMLAGGPPPAPPRAGVAAPAAPGAPAGAPRRVSSPEEARKLPKGTLFQTPDGRVMRVP
jgi:hypothetical protein